MSVFQCSKFSAADISAINAGCCTGQLRYSILNGTASSKELAGLKAFAESRAGLAENDAKKYWNSAKVLISITSVAIAGLCAVGSIYGTVLFAAGYALSACGLLGYLGFVYYDAKCAIETTKNRNFKQIAVDAAYKKPSLLSPGLWLSKCRQMLSTLLSNKKGIGLIMGSGIGLFVVFKAIIAYQYICLYYYLNGNPIPISREIAGDCCLAVSFFAFSYSLICGISEINAKQ